MRDLMDVEVREKADPRRRLLAGIFRVLDDSGAAWCLSHGHDILAGQVPTDIDCILDSKLSPIELVKLLASREHELGARVVQWLDDGAQWIVLASDDEKPVILQLHISYNYELDDRIFYPGRRLLQHRQRQDDFWVTAPAFEFGCVLISRICKGRLDVRRRERISDLYEADPAGCMLQVERFFLATHARLIVKAARTRDWNEVSARLPDLRVALCSPRPRASRTKSWKRRIQRWKKPPHGFHAVFLGSDGAGKSTAIESVRHDLANAFLRTETFDFAPSFIPPPLQPKYTPPHTKKPRSYLGSLLKAGWWALVYWIGYRVILRRARARATLILNHRYLLDAIVDPKRYRYAGPIWLLKTIWRFACKPDVVFFLDGDPRKIWERKKELSIEEIARQRGEYRALVEGLSNGKVIDGSQSASQVATNIDRIILDQMSANMQKRLGTHLEVHP